MSQANPFDRETSAGKYLTTFQRRLLEKQLERESVPEYRQRIEIALLADAGLTQAQISRQLNCSPLTARHWMFVAQSGQAHNWQSQPIGRPKTITPDYRARLKELASSSPKDWGYPFSRWTGAWLSRHLSQEFDIRISARHINRLLESMQAELNAADRSRSHHRSTRIEIADLQVTVQEH